MFSFLEEVLSILIICRRLSFELWSVVLQLPSQCFYQFCRRTPDLIDCTSTRGAMIGLVRAPSKITGDRRIQYNVVVLGPIWTPLMWLDGLSDWQHGG